MRKIARLPSFQRYRSFWYTNLCIQIVRRHVRANGMVRFHDLGCSISYKEPRRSQNGHVGQFLSLLECCTQYLGLFILFTKLRGRLSLVVYIYKAAQLQFSRCNSFWVKKLLIFRVQIEEISVFGEYLFRHLALRRIDFDSFGHMRY